MIERKYSYISVGELLTEFGIWAKHTARKILHSRRAQEITLAFALGLLLGVVGLRATVKPIAYVERPIPAETEPETVAEPVIVADPDAEAIARVLYGIRDYKLSDTAKRAVIEVITNRRDCTYGEFGDTVQEVCNKPEQWQGYNPDGSYLQADYDIAFDMLHAIRPAARVIPEGCYFLVVKSGEVIARTEWSGGNAWSVK